jgi:hypothetical protein
MLDPSYGYGAESCRGLARRSRSAWPSIANSGGKFSLDHRVGVIEYLCGSVFCVATGAMIYADNSHFFITEVIAIEASENASQVVNRSHKGDRLSGSVLQTSKAVLIRERSEIREVAS